MVICPDHQAIARAVAGEIVDYIQGQEEKGEQAVLGLATGSTPIGVYGELVARHKMGISFSHVVTIQP